jgi:hypothetical protein
MKLVFNGNSLNAPQQEAGKYILKYPYMKIPYVIYLSIEVFHPALMSVIEVKLFNKNCCFSSPGCLSCTCSRIAFFGLLNPVSIGKAA